MKKNKKLFLASIAAMGAVAIGTGAVSTFAWYTATTSVKISASGDALGLTTTQSTVSFSSLDVTITIASEDNVQLSNINGANVEYGAVPNGVEAEKQVSNWTGNNATVKLIGTYTATAEASPSDAQKESLKNLNVDYVQLSVI